MLSYHQQKLLSYFEDSVKNDTVRHAYILKGAHGVGKKYVSRIAELYFACREGRACNECNGCKSARAGANPDIIHLSPNEKNRYDIKSVRELIRKIYEKPAGSRYKFVTIESAHLLETACQNALLKIIEEPPSYAVFLLLCDNINNILPTILSRVMMLELLPWTTDELKAFFPLPEADSFLYNYCMGNPGTLEAIFKDEDFKANRNTAADLLLKLGKSPGIGVYEATDALVSRKEHLTPMLEVMTLLSRDAVFYKNGLSAQIVNTDKMREIKAMCDTLTMSQALKMAEICGAMPAALKNNENINMQIQTMFMKLSTLFER